MQTFVCFFKIPPQLWRKFGDAKNDGPGPNPSNTTTTDDVFLVLTSNKEVLEIKCFFFSSFKNILKPWPNGLASRHKFAKAELAYGLARGG